MGAVSLWTRPPGPSAARDEFLSRCNCGSTTVLSTTAPVELAPPENRGTDHLIHTQLGIICGPTSSLDHVNLPLRHDKGYARPAQQRHRPPYTAIGNLDGLLEQTDHGKQPLRHQMEDDDLVDELQVWRARVVAHNDVPARPAYQGHRSPRTRNATVETPWSAEQQDHENRPVHHDKKIDDHR